MEISLDVEWAHAIAPLAKIMLDEVASSSMTDLLGGNTYAAEHGATVVSNSWGSSESSGETALDSTFSAFPGVTFVFSSGDSGVQSYPADSPYVVGVGGTTLSYNSSYQWTGETAWSSSGGGLSAYESTPSYQAGLGLTSRGAPDLSYDANPNTGFAVYDSVRYSGQSGWFQGGGTSAGAPQWSALITLADEGRIAAGKTALSGAQLLTAIYSFQTSTSGTTPFYDVTSGGNSVATAGPGYDLVTGMGTPRRADLFFEAIVSY